MSEYYTKQRGHLQVLLESLISEIVRTVLGGLSIISRPIPSCTSAMRESMGLLWAVV